MSQRILRRGGLRRYADGGGVGVKDRDTIPSPQSQKDPGNDSRGVVGSQSWYENYGSGPEHLFLGDRQVPIASIRPSTGQTLPPPTSSGGGSSLGDYIPLLGMGAVVGNDLYDWWKNNYGENSLNGIDWSSVDLDPDQVNTQGTLDWINQDLSDLEMPTAEFDPSVWDRLGQGASGAFNLGLGAMQGGVGGAGSMLQGGGDIYQALGGESAIADRLGTVGSLLSNLGDGTVQGYLQAGGDASELAQALGYSGPITDAAGKFLPIVGDLFNAYESYKQGGVRGYVNSIGSLMQAYTGAQAAGLLGGSAAAGAGAAGAGAAGAAGAASAGAAGAAGATGAAGAGTAAAGTAGTAGTAGAGTAGASGGALSSVGPALALWALAASAIDWAGKKYGDTKVGDIHGTDFMGGPVDETHYYVRNPFEGDIGSFHVNIDDIGAAPTAALRDQWQQQGIDDSAISDYDARMLALMQQRGDTEGYQDYMGWLTDENQQQKIEDSMKDFDWSSIIPAAAKGGPVTRNQMHTKKFNQGGLSMANRPSPTGPKSYYRYGAPTAPSPMNTPPGMPSLPSAPPMMRRAMGGLAMYGFNTGGPQRLVKGPGTGRSDDIPARLSDGEYVFDAETVALLGDGSTDEGARRLDALRQKLRKHKGKQLSRGKFSSAAKNPEDYLE